MPSIKQPKTNSPLTRENVVREYLALKNLLGRSPKCRDSRRLHHRAVQCPTLGSWSALVEEAKQGDFEQQLAERYWALKERLGRTPFATDDHKLKRDATRIYMTWSEFQRKIGDTPRPNAKRPEQTPITKLGYYPDLLQRMVSYVIEHGKFPRARAGHGKEWDLRDVPYDSDLPGRSTYVRAFGSMRAVQNAVLAELIKQHQPLTA